nr:MAG TPA: hypothetical protein [Caudoviricetes sp.]
MDRGIPCPPKNYTTLEYEECKLYTKPERLCRCYVIVCWYTGSHYNIGFFLS